MFFLGTFDYAMDERGRLPLPPRYRDVFREGAVLSQGVPDRCLHVYPKDAFELRARQFTAQSAMHWKGRVLRHSLFPRSHHVELDGQNRILIPAPLREYARLSGKVLVVGGGEWLEVWSPAEFEAVMALVDEQLEPTLESIEPGSGRDGDASYAGHAEGSHRRAERGRGRPLRRLHTRWRRPCRSDPRGGAAGRRTARHRRRPAAIERTSERLADYGDSFRAVEANFRDVGRVCRDLGFAPVNGVLMDLGLSSDQLEEGSGFSFQREMPLDMRFSGEGTSAAGHRQHVQRAGARGHHLPLWRGAGKPPDRPPHHQLVRSGRAPN